MEYIKFGNTGMDVSRICLGCMSFGKVLPGGHQWVLDEENSRPIIKRALELGINFLIQLIFTQVVPVKRLSDVRLRSMRIGMKLYLPRRSGARCVQVLMVVGFLEKLL